MSNPMNCERPGAAGSGKVTIMPTRVYRASLRAAVLVVMSMAASACSLDSLLEVELPGSVEEEALGDPALAPVLTQSVIADFECAWNNYVAGTALVSDQFLQASGNLNQRNWGTRRVQSNDASYSQQGCGSPYGIYTPLHTARFQAEDVFNRITAFPDAQVPGKTGMLATVRVYGAYALLALGEGFCEMAIDLGPLMTRQEVLVLAESRFTEGLTLAQQANNADMQNLARVGRARVRLDLADFAGAIADASLVSDGYVKNASRDETTTGRYNALCNYLTCPTFGRNATIAPNYRDVTWAGVPDPRVNVITTNRVAADNATAHWYPADKANTRTAPVLLASHREALLIIAEASARAGDLPTARGIINDLHDAAGIPGYDLTSTATQSQVIAQVIEERRREMFLDGGHRFNDHIRFAGTEWAVPYKGDPGSIHPDGVDHTGVPYGTTTCFELPDVERSSNPNL